MDRKLPEREKELLKLRARTVFEKLDRGGDGMICLEELQLGLEELKLPQVPQAQFDEFFKVIDADNDQKICFEEFLLFVTKREEEVWKVFLEIDNSGDFKISSDEIRASLKKVGVQPKEKDLVDLIRFLDSDRDDHVEWEEFRDFLLLLPVVDPLDEKIVWKKWSRSAALQFGEISFTIPEDSIPLLKSLESTRIFCAGAIAGMVSRTATAPFDRLKTIMQASSSEAKLGIMSGLRNIYLEGGWVGFFRGNGTNVLKVSPESAMKFFAYDFFQSRISKSGLLKFGAPNSKDSSNFLEKMVAGGLAGSVSLTAIYPLEVTKTRLSIASKGTYSGIMDCLGKTVAQEGTKGLYKGWIPSVIGIIPYAGVDLGVYATLRDRFIDKNQPPSPVTVLLCGATSSTCGQVVSYPLQLVRTKLQIQGSPGHPVLYSSMTDCFKKILTNEGVVGLYRGILPNFIKVT
jgi:solute carrier family 25 phosphate transporter 23/24/25/41